MYKGNIFLTTDNNRAVAGSMELRIYGITELRSLRIDYESGKDSSWLSAQCSQPNPSMPLDFCH